MIELLDKEGLERAQEMVAGSHYLKRRVDPRCSPMGYAITVYDRIGPDTAGYLLFGRPEATRCRDWYGSVEDAREGRCEVTRWQVLNLARVYIWSFYQQEDWRCERELPKLVPGFLDRHGIWRSTLASTAINEALDRVVLDYLLQRPPCFLEEPYELAWCLSYCDTRVHRGTLYRAAGFELYCQNRRGIQTWRRKLRPLTGEEHARVAEASRVSARSRRYRARRAVGQLEFVA